MLALNSMLEVKCIKQPKFLKVQTDKVGSRPFFFNLFKFKGKGTLAAPTERAKNMVPEWGQIIYQSIGSLLTTIVTFPIRAFLYFLVSLIKLAGTYLHILLLVTVTKHFSYCIILINVSAHYSKGFPPKSVEYIQKDSQSKEGKNMGDILYLGVYMYNSLIMFMLNLKVRNSCSVYYTNREIGQKNF